MAKQHSYSESWIRERFIPKGLQYGFQVHKQNKGRKPLSLPIVHLSMCNNISADNANGMKFCTFKYVTKLHERYNAGEVGIGNLFYQS
jgi:hypothetical protein